MKKGVIPIPYIVALIFGVAVIALLGYLFVAQGGKTIKGGTEAECQSKLFRYCLLWDKNNCAVDGPADISFEGCDFTADIIDKCQEIGFCKVE